MRFYSNNIKNLFNHIENDKIKVVLLYGPNRGFINTILEQIIKKLNLSVNNYSYKDINSANLNSIVNSQDFFSSKILVKINEVSNTINKDLKNLLSNFSNDFINIVFFIGGESMPNSGIRKFFEDNNNLASIGCYYEEPETIKKMILQQAQRHNKNFDSEALNYLKYALQVDHKIIKSELEKVFLYNMDKDTIDIDGVLDIVSDHIVANGDDMCTFFIQNEFNKFLSEIDKLLQQNINPVLILRGLSRYFINMYTVINLQKEGVFIDQAIKTLIPPIFYKHINMFKHNIEKVKNLDIIRIISDLQQAEVSYKINPLGFSFSSLINEKNFS